MAQRTHSAMGYDNSGPFRPYVASTMPCQCHPERNGSLFVVYAGGGRIDFPIRYHDGRIAYDWPERVPVAAKRLVERAYSA